MNTIVDDLIKAFGTNPPVVLYNCAPTNIQEEYDKKRQVFNRSFQFYPTAIVMCTNKEQVSVGVKFASKKGLPLRVRSGGHDHEGECSGTDVILLDLSGISGKENLNFNKGKTVAYIGAGYKFEDLTTALAHQEVMIPHGTCATVGIAGFTLGGGWGPWTRLHGMCCESLADATIVLADGEIIDSVAEYMKKNEKPDTESLLWALKGGGGFSYGIVTTFAINTFPLKSEIHRFEIDWNPLDAENKPGGDTNTARILDVWEELILNSDFIELVGTNLKILGNPVEKENPKDWFSAINNCTMYGYWEGNKESLQYFYKNQIEKQAPGGIFVIDPQPNGTLHKLAGDYGKQMMGHWGRYSHQQTRNRMKGLGAEPFKPDYDEPAPHKITSRFVVNAEDRGFSGLSSAGKESLINSLNSSLLYCTDDNGLPMNNVGLGLYSYVTLGAISGNYYQNKIKPEQKEASAFPYKNCTYTIQYQTWWNETPAEKAEEENNEVYMLVNRALDWMEHCRDLEIDGTGGSFISFKDSSVQTKTYFDKNYDKLIKVKKAYTKDPFNHFKSRKTIL